jgi:hypothetical protein
MRRLALSLLLLTTTSVWAQETAPVLPPTVEDLGGGRYRIGAIVLDQSAGSFTVPGRVLRLEGPLEYLAVTVGGIKGYESLLELDADAFQFNLACILIGLTTDDIVPPDFQFDVDEVIGPQVRIRAEWGTDDDRVEVAADQLIVVEGEALVGSQWAYFGSTHFPGSTELFLAHQTGTLIGLVHDPASIIEHRTGVGIGRYGSVAGNGVLLAEIGMELTLRIEIVDSAAPASN